MILSVRRQLVVGIMFCACCTASELAQAQLRVVTYNTATAAPQNGVTTARPGLDTVLAAIGDENVGGIAKPVDVLLLQEQFTMATSTQSIVDILNDIYDPVDRTMYARSSLNGSMTSFNGAGGRPGLVYNTQSVELIGEIAFGTVNTSSQPRESLRYQLRPVGYDSSTDFYVYNDHYKADDGSADQARRLVEAQAVRNNADALGQGAHIIYAGDFNIHRSTESMYVELLSSGNGQAFDPIDISGTWHNSSSKRITHTQSPAVTSQFAGQSLGGMDDRFDFQLTTEEMLDGEGLSYISGSYHAFGNNGSHSCCNSAITSGNGAAPNVLNALMTASDHLPVVADYQLPAKMSAMLAEVPATVPMGANFTLDVLVENIADVLVPAGADELDYSVSVSGDLFGGGTGVDAALGGPSLFSIGLDTSVAGLRSGLVTVTTDSQGAGNTLMTLPVSFVVGQTSQIPFLARDNFDGPTSSIGLNSFVQSPLPGAFTSLGDGFERYQVGVSSSIPFSLIDETNAGKSTDALGVIDAATKSDGWFGITDTANDDNPTGLGTATWEFDIVGASNLEVSIDMAAMGDFEETAGGGDFFNWTYSIDNGPTLDLFSSMIAEDASADYTLADGDVVTHNDPVVITSNSNVSTQLSNLLQTLTTDIVGSGQTLTIELSARADGTSEAFAFDNIIVQGILFLADDADFDQDGDIDGSDFLTWQRGFGTGTTLAQGDANGDGEVDAEDLAVWQTQFGTSPESLQQLATNVPEPGSLMLLLGCLLAVAGGKNR